MLVYNQCLTKRDHEKYTQDSSAQCDQCDRKDTRSITFSLYCPHENSRQSKDCSSCQGLTCRTDGLYHVVLQNGILFQDDADHSHGDYSCRDRCRYGHTYTQSQIRICCSKENCQKASQHCSRHRKFRHHFVCRNIRFEVCFVFHLSFLNSSFFS